MITLLDKVLLRATRYLPLSHRRKWLIGMRDEVDFWDRHIGTNYTLVNGLAASEEGRVRSDPATPVQPDYLELLMPCADSPIRILDVGSGPFSRVGRTIPGRQVELVAVDPLADKYAELCRKHGVTPPVPPVQLAGEQLTTLFPHDHFHFAHANNCLDHAFDPVRAIEEMVAVVKPGCHVYLRHELNVADTSDWIGLHQWNFRLRDDHFLVCDRRTEVSMAERLAGRATVVSRMEGRFLVNVIRKVGDRMAE